MKKKHFLKKHFGPNAKFNTVFQPVLSSGIVLLDGGIISIPLIITTSLIGAGVGTAGDTYLAHIVKCEFTSTSGQSLKASKWAKKEFQKLETVLIKAYENKYNAKQTEVLKELRDLEAHIEITDKSYTEIYYATKSGISTDPAVRGSLINSKGQARFLKPRGLKPNQDGG